MPVSKAASYRHKLLDSFFRNTSRKWTKKLLLEAMNKKLTEEIGPEATISLSQIRNDIEDMKSIHGAGIEMRREGSEYFYYYEDPNETIFKINIVEKDMALLHLSVHLLRQIHGFSLAEEISEIVNKLENRIELPEDLKSSVIAFENSPVALGADNIGDIYEAIINKRLLKIKYQHFKASTAVEEVISPYYLKEYNNRWFMFGWNTSANRLENKPLDRILDIRVTSGDYKENDCFYPEEYFKNIVGVTNTHGKIENIELLFTAHRAPYVRTKPLHHDQTLKLYADGTLKIKISLKINPELKSLILGFGKDVEVLGPPALREEIKQLLKDTVEKYE